MATKTVRRVLVYGGRGALGNACVQLFSRHGYLVSSVDFKPNESAHTNLIVPHSARWEEQANCVLNGIAQLLGDSCKLDAVLCMAGGWQGGSARSDAFISSCDNSWRQSVWSSTISARVASKFLVADGTLVLSGASAALHAAPTPTMIGYGMAKAAVHQLTRSLAAEKGGLPRRAFVAALCPVTLDTPANHAAMPGADVKRNNWTPLEAVSERIRDWVEGRERPPSGSWVQVSTQEGRTQFEVV